MIPLPSQPKIIQKKDNMAIFEIEGLYPGYGETIANSLRRVLLSSLEGAAITQIKIKGVSHEFSTIPGVLEDVVLVILNLKKINFKLFGPESQTITLVVKGEKEVKAKDFKLPSQVEIANPQAHIVTLTKSSAEFNMEVQVEKGVGYVPVEKREMKKSEIGVIPIDAIFTPVKKVSFSVDNMRVGKRTDFDRLRIEIETDGTISPQEALTESSEILLGQFSIFPQTFKKVEKVPSSLVVLKRKKTEKKMEKKGEKKEDVGKIKVETLKISERTKNALLKNNVKTIGGILKKSEKDLLGLEGFGGKGVKELKKVLAKFSLELKQS